MMVLASAVAQRAFSAPRCWLAITVFLHQAVALRRASVSGWCRLSAAHLNFGLVGHAQGTFDVMLALFERQRKY
jgi:hypothetical protein